MNTLDPTMARAAFAATWAGLDREAAKFIERISADPATTGGVVIAMQIWIDDAARGLAVDPQLPLLLNLVAPDGSLVGIDDVDRRCAWASRMISARLSHDQDNWNALLKTLRTVDGREMFALVFTLLRMCAHGLSMPMPQTMN